MKKKGEGAIPLPFPSDATGKPESKLLDELRAFRSEYSISPSKSIRTSWGAPLCGRWWFLLRSHAYRSSCPGDCAVTGEFPESFIPSFDAFPRMSPRLDHRSSDDQRRSPDATRSPRSNPTRMLQSGQQIADESTANVRRIGRHKK